MPTKAELSQDLNLDVAGTGDPIDFQTYGQEFLAFYQMMSQDKDIAGDATKRFALKQQLGRVFRIEDLESIIGTAEEAQQKAQQESEMGQAQMQLEVEKQKSEIARNLKGTPEEAQRQQDQGQPPPVEQQGKAVEAAAQGQADAAQAAAGANGAGATVGA